MLNEDVRYIICFSSLGGSTQIKGCGIEGQQNCLTHKMTDTMRRRQISSRYMIAVKPAISVPVKALMSVMANVIPALGPSCKMKEAFGW
jgi:hypothetical protein